MKCFRFDTPLDVYLANEEWRQVFGYEGIYEVSSLGRVRRVRGGPGARVGKIIKQQIAGKGYLYVMLCDNGKSSKRRLRVNRLVASAFLGLIGNHQEVNHKDRVKTNNRVDNLEIVTSSENSQHYVMNADPKLFRLDPDKVRAIRSSGETSTALSKRLGVNAKTIADAKSGRTWRFVD